MTPTPCAPSCCGQPESFVGVVVSCASMGHTCIIERDLAVPQAVAQPPAEEMDRILLEYARAAGFSTAGYKNDRAYWRRQVGWMIKQHADRLRYG